MPRCLLFAAAVLTCSATGFAQEPSGLPGAVPEHEVLQRFVGKWKSVSSAMEDGQVTFKAEGIINAQLLGEFWVLSETKVEMDNFKMKALQTIGYDQQKKKYVGTWVDSMVNYMWHYEGSHEGNKLVLNTEGPNYMTDGKMAKFRDIYEFVNENEIKARSEIWQDEKWVVFMKGTSTRLKSE